MTRAPMRRALHRWICGDLAAAHPPGAVRRRQDRADAGDAAPGSARRRSSDFRGRATPKPAVRPTSRTTPGHVASDDRESGQPPTTPSFAYSCTLSDAGRALPLTAPTFRRLIARCPRPALTFLLNTGGIPVLWPRRSALRLTSASSGGSTAPRPSILYLARTRRHRALRAVASQGRPARADPAAWFSNLYLAGDCDRELFTAVVSKPRYFRTSSRGPLRQPNTSTGAFGGTTKSMTPVSLRSG